MVERARPTRQPRADAGGDAATHEQPQRGLPGRHWRDDQLPEEHGCAGSPHAEHDSVPRQPRSWSVSAVDLRRSIDEKLIFAPEKTLRSTQLDFDARLVGTLRPVLAGAKAHLVLHRSRPRLVRSDGRPDPARVAFGRLVLQHAAPAACAAFVRSVRVCTAERWTTTAEQPLAAASERVPAAAAAATTATWAGTESVRSCAATATAPTAAAAAAATSSASTSTFVVVVVVGTTERRKCESSRPQLVAAAGTESTTPRCAICSPGLHQRSCVCAPCPSAAATSASSSPVNRSSRVGRAGMGRPASRVACRGRYCLSETEFQVFGKVWVPDRCRCRWR